MKTTCKVKGETQIVGKAMKMSKFFIVKKQIKM